MPVVSMGNNSLLVIFIGCFALLRLLSVDTWNCRPHAPLFDLWKVISWGTRWMLTNQSKKSEPC